MNCYRCEGLLVVDRGVIEETKQALAELMISLIEHAKKTGLDHHKLPVLTKVAMAIRVMESVR